MQKVLIPKGIPMVLHPINSADIPDPADVPAHVAHPSMNSVACLES